MLDNETYINNNNSKSFNYNINAVSGTIRKSHPKSFITKTTLDETLLDKINPRYTVSKTEYYDKNDFNGYQSTKDCSVFILQVMLCGNDQCLVEFVLKEDFENIK